MKDQGLTTAWDDHLSYLLTPALSAYETERVTGRSLHSQRLVISHIHALHVWCLNLDAEVVNLKYGIYSHFVLTMYKRLS